MAERYWIETLGCPKNQVDSDKLIGTLAADGLEPASSPGDAELVVVNTCAFIEAARQESIDTILTLSADRRPGARLVVTGCMAERYSDELAAALPEVDLVAPFGVPLNPAPSSSETTGGTADRRTASDTARIASTASTSALSTPVALGRKPTKPTKPTKPKGTRPTNGTTREPPLFDLLNLPRPRATAPWAYVKVAEGCDRRCGFCAIPSFRGRQRSRTFEEILQEVEDLHGPDGTLREIVLVAQDLASFALDRAGDPAGALDRAGGGERSASLVRPGGRRSRSLDDPPTTRRPIVDLVKAVHERVAWTRLLYLYPSALDAALVDAVLSTGVPYFDLSLQHVSRPLLARMRRWGDGDRFLDRIASIRSAEPAASFRSSFIIGYPGETEEDHDQLLQWIAAADLDWVGFFPFSREAGTYAADLDDQVPAELVGERIAECGELQDSITARRREALIGTTVTVLVDGPGVGRTYREAPEIDGIVVVPEDISAGTFVEMVVTGAEGPDLHAVPVHAYSAQAELPQRAEPLAPADGAAPGLPTTRSRSASPHRSQSASSQPSRSDRDTRTLTETAR